MAAGSGGSRWRRCGRRCGIAAAWSATGIAQQRLHDQLNALCPGLSAPVGHGKALAVEGVTGQAVLDCGVYPSSWSTVLAFTDLDLVRGRAVARLRRIGSSDLEVPRRATGPAFRCENPARSCSVR